MLGGTPVGTLSSSRRTRTSLMSFARWKGRAARVRRLFPKLTWPILDFFSAPKRIFSARVLDTVAAPLHQLGILPRQSLHPRINVWLWFRINLSQVRWVAAVTGRRRWWRRW